MLTFDNCAGLSSIVPDELKPEIRQRFFEFFDEGDYQVSLDRLVSCIIGGYGLMYCRILRSLELSSGRWSLLLARSTLEHGNASH